MSEVSQSDLLNFLYERFNLSEIRTLCFELGIPYEDLAGAGFKPKLISLITYAQRHGRYEALVTYAQNQRANIPIPGANAIIKDPANDPNPSHTTYNIYGGVNAIGSESKIEAAQIAGRDIQINQVPETKDAFKTQLQELQTLVQTAIENKEFQNTNDAEFLEEDIVDLLKDTAKESPRKSRMLRRLDNIAEIIDDAGQMAKRINNTTAKVLEAVPVVASLIEAANRLF